MRFALAWIICGRSACDGFVSQLQKRRTPVVAADRSIGETDVVDNDEHNQRLKRLAAELRQRIRANQDPKYWSPVYKALDDVDIEEWLFAVEEFAGTRDGSPEANATLQEWEGKFSVKPSLATADIQQELTQPSTLGTTSPKERWLDRFVEFMAEAVDKTIWEAEGRVVVVRVDPGNHEISGKPLQETLDAIGAIASDTEFEAQATRESATVRILFLNETDKGVVFFDASGTEEDWRQSLSKLGLLNQKSAKRIKTCLQDTLKNAAEEGAERSLNIQPHNEKFLEFQLEGDWTLKDLKEREFNVRVKVEAGSGSGTSMLVPKLSVTKIREIRGLPALPYNEKFVKIKTPGDRDWKTLFDEPSVPSKGRVKVVAGESGSGKTTFATKAPMKAVPDTAVLFAKPDQEAIDAFAKEVYGEKFAEAFCRRIAQIFDRKDVKDETRFYDKLGHTKSLISFDRNRKAINIAADAWRTAARQVGQVGWWDEGSATPLPHLTLVLDEAVQLDFGRSIVDMGRYMCEDVQKKGLAKRVDIVLVGTGLERVKSSARQYGTDPGKFVVISLETPDLNEIGKEGGLTNAQLVGVEQGVYSRVLASNSRMLFHAVLPIIQQAHHTDKLEEISEVPGDRLTTIGSTRILMDYALRVYLTQNSVSTLNTETKRKYVDACFHYHLLSSQQALYEQTNQTQRRNLLLLEGKADLEALSGRLFDRGLARSDGKTSNALKLLACFGSANVLKVSDGGSFEELLAYHLARQAQVWDGSNSYLHGKLEHRWPPPIQSKAEKKKLGGGGARAIRELVETKIGDAEEENLCEAIKEKQDDGIDSFSLAFWQAGSNAQGPDIFQLKVSGRKASLDIFQCKNYADAKKIPWKKAFEVIGVGQDADGSYRIRNDTRSAYAKLAVDKLCERISAGTGLSVDVGLRVVVVSSSFHHLSKDNVGDLPDGCKILVRELLEPTISCLLPPMSKDSGRDDDWDKDNRLRQMLLSMAHNS